ncbi:hypothetical protein JEQ12_002118 [Ovis aries]|uniref:HMG box domain-containing protein n=1 Tax=Ovis aries TaxID=9940 RepID=A0A836A0B0_SHEEP|nr:hypothetical protein JEQ12_002118 [Ovis aries]
MDSEVCEPVDAGDTMSAKEKGKFEDMAKADKARYEREMKTYIPPKGETKKKFKDPNAPKRPPSAFFLFCSEYRPKIKGEHPGLSIGDVAKKLGEMWNNTAADDKQPYEKKAAKLKEKYEKVDDNTSSERKDMPPTGEGANRHSQMQKEQQTWLKDTGVVGGGNANFPGGGNSNCSRQGGVLTTDFHYCGALLNPGSHSRTTVVAEFVMDARTGDKMVEKEGSTESPAVLPYSSKVGPLSQSSVRSPHPPVLRLRRGGVHALLLL